MIVNDIKPEALEGINLAADRYQVKSQLGEGSMAWVYLAWDSRLKTDVVIKVPKAERISNVEFLGRFRLESQVMVKLTHPHVVRIQDVGEHDGLPFVVMQYLPGGTLKQQIKGPADVSSLGTWLREIARSLDFMHSRDVIHRDVKPANILFDESGNPFMSDFGLTKVHGKNSEAESDLSAAGLVVGTPNYLAPEVVFGRGYDHRTDQYSLAVCIYHAMTGSPPMQGATVSATMVNQTQRVLPLLSDVRDDFPASSAQAVQRGLAKTPDERFDTCEQLAVAVLDGLSASSSSTDTPKNRTSRSSDDTDSIRTSSSSSRAERRRRPTQSLDEYESGAEYDYYAETDAYHSPPRRRAGKRGGGKKAGRSEKRSQKVRQRTVKCPGCARQLPVQKIHAGRTGSCIYCHQRVRVTKDLSKAIALKDGKSSGEEADLVLGEKMFGLNISRRTAAIVAGGLGVLIICATVFISVWATQQSDSEKLLEDVKAYRSME